VSADIIGPILFKETFSIPLIFEAALVINLMTFVPIFLINRWESQNDERRRTFRYIRKASSTISQGKIGPYELEHARQLHKVIFQKHTVKVAHVKKLKFEFWLMCVLVTLDQMLVHPFVQNSSPLFQTKFNLSIKESGYLVAAPWMVFVIVGTPLGLLVDRMGNRANLLVAGLFCSLAAYISFALLPDCPVDEKCYSAVLPMILLGFANLLNQLSLYCVVNLTIKERLYGTSFGLA